MKKVKLGIVVALVITLIALVIPINKYIKSTKEDHYTTTGLYIGDVEVFYIDQYAENVCSDKTYYSLMVVENLYDEYTWFLKGLPIEPTTSTCEISSDYYVKIHKIDGWESWYAANSTKEYITIREYTDRFDVNEATLLLAFDEDFVVNFESEFWSASLEDLLLEKADRDLSETYMTEIYEVIMDLYKVDGVCPVDQIILWEDILEYLNDDLLHYYNQEFDSGTVAHLYSNCNVRLSLDPLEDSICYTLHKKDYVVGMDCKD